MSELINAFEVEGQLKFKQEIDILEMEIERFVDSGGFTGYISFPLLEKLKELNGKNIKISVEVLK